MRERWGTDRVAALAPDRGSIRQAIGATDPTRWQAYGAGDRVVWGVYGTRRSARRVAVDLEGPAFTCTCAAQKKAGKTAGKTPCKHALALLLLWSRQLVPDDPAVPPFAADWLRARDAAASGERPRPRDEAAAAKRAAERHRRVCDGLAELDRWLRDRVRTGLAQTAGDAGVERMAARLVDAQAPGAANLVRRSAGTPASGSGWPARLLAEYARLRLLVRAYHRIEALPPERAATVRSRVGYTVTRDEVLARQGVRDRWVVHAIRDSADGRVETRRVWLRGADTGRWALVLLFAAGGTSLSSHPDAVLLPGTVLDADLHFYPGQPLRALVGVRHGDLGRAGAPEAGDVGAFLDDYAAALAEDPWLVEWPAVLTGVPVSGSGWELHSGDGALPLELSGVDIWPLVATSGGEPVPVAGEWTGSALRPLTCWHGDRAVRLGTEPEPARRWGWW